jgi:hypothetical protein
MTERKPSGVSFESWVERQLREARERGSFEGLAGTGKPLPRTTSDELAWVREKVRQEELPVSALLPPGLAVAKEVEDLPGRLARERSEHRVRAIVTELNGRIDAARRGPQVGPPVRTAMLGVGWWHTVMRAGRDDGQPLIGDPARTAGVVAVGVDETAFLAASAGFHTQFVTGIVAMSGPGRERAQLLDVVPGRSGSVVQQWISGQDPAWRQQVTTASLDPFRGYATALRTSLPEAVRVLDAFHVVRLGQAAVDDVRRRRQQETLGRRAHREDPLYRGRRLLRRGALALKRRQWTKVALTPTVGDPRGQLTGAWVVAQELQLLYARSHELADTQGRLWRILDRCARSDVPSCCASRAPSTPGPAG